MQYSVYKHTFPNGKIYIGITCQKLEERWRNGNGYLVKNKNNEFHQPLMARAIQKYGWSNIKHEVIYTELTKKEAEEKEQKLISQHKSNNVNYGYNIENGGNSIGKHTEVVRKKISENKKGKKLPPFSEEHKRKIGESKKNKKRLDLSKRNQASGVPTICLETGICYLSSHEAEKILNVHHSSIRWVCKGKRQTAGGYHWKYLYDQTRKDGTIIQGAITLGLITEEEALAQLAQQNDLQK